MKEVLRAKQNSRKKRVSRQTCIATQNNDLFISQTAAADYSERFQDMYTFSELILNIRKVGKIDSREMQGQSTFRDFRAIQFFPNPYSPMTKMVQLY